MAKVEPSLLGILLTNKTLQSSYLTEVAAQLTWPTSSENRFTGRLISWNKTSGAQNSPIFWTCVRQWCCGNDFWGIFGVSLFGWWFCVQLRKVTGKCMLWIFGGFRKTKKEEMLRHIDAGISSWRDALAHWCRHFILERNAAVHDGSWCVHVCA